MIQSIPKKCYVIWSSKILCMEKAKIYADPKYANTNGIKVIMQPLFPTTVLSCFVSVLSLDGMFREAPNILFWS